MHGSPFFMLHNILTLLTLVIFAVIAFCERTICIHLYYVSSHDFAIFCRGIITLPIFCAHFWDPITPDLKVSECHVPFSPPAMTRANKNYWKIHQVTGFNRTWHDEPIKSRNVQLPNTPWSNICMPCATRIYL